MDEDTFGGPSASGSSSRLPPLSTLTTWVHRPAAVAKCFLSDVFSMRPLLQAESERMRYAGRDVFMLGTTPCKMVEVVAWVSGITQRESSMVVYVDDGDGETVLPVTVKLQLVAVQPSFNDRGNSTPHGPALEGEEFRPSHFLSAKDRKEQKRKLAAVEYERAQAKKRTVMRVYERKDLRVGDTVRIRGRVDEWSRGKPGGAVQWVRELVVEEGSGGSIVAVQPEEQFDHIEEVRRLHLSRYTQPFIMPPLPAVLGSSANAESEFVSPPRPNLSNSTIHDSMDMSSELPSELSITGDLSLRPPHELRSSQLTDRTFRQYLLDHISQATSSTLAIVEASGPSSLRRLLEDTFPECKTSASSKGKRPMHHRVLCVTSPNSQSADLTPTQLRPHKHVQAKPFSYLSTSPSPLPRLHPWTITSILEVAHLQELAMLIVDSEAKKEERRRRRRIRDGQGRPKDFETEQTRLRAGRKADDWHLRTSEKERRMQKLVGWCIRGIHEDGGLVQVELKDFDQGLLSRSIDTSESMVSSTSSMWSNRVYKSAEQFGYIALTPPLVLPLLLPHFEAERERRNRVFLPKNDPRKGNGMTVVEALNRLRAWGSDGRWERVGEWVVEEAIDLGVRRGMLRREGKGWWAVEVL